MTKTNERREAAQAIAAKLRELTPEQLQQMAANAGIRTIGRSLSMQNQCMVASQYPAASLVGGFAAWKASGRVVKKGERGLAIWVPMIGKQRDDDTQPPALRGFRLDYVFDIRQTEELDAERIKRD